ncbi:MAG: flagellar biosynthesis anti-sigma factor FlgM [Oscillospiraceae bacterium]|jgi:negative regulator of flagellin synthesis FlgM|nr:flagellar biosynthesis anti-sigma factor FlgM [Oscillospiraceae bacterium]
MKIASVPLSAQVHAYGKTGQKTSVPRACSQAPDVVEISPNVRPLGEFLRAAQSAPDVRMERVTALRQQIEAGTYRVDGRAVAERLLAHTAAQL